MDIKHDPRQYSHSLADNIVAYVESINEETGIPIDRSGETKLHVVKENNHTVLVFEFGGTQIHRNCWSCCTSTG